MLSGVYVARRLMSFVLMFMLAATSAGVVLRLDAAAQKRPPATSSATQKRRSAAAAQTARPARQQSGSLSTEARAALSSVSAGSLRGHLSFIASDALEGRDTPSRGLDIAAEYIAAQFRRAGLEPVGDDVYFQTANMVLRERNLQGFELGMQADGERIAVGADEVSLAYGLGLQAADGALDIAGAEVVKVAFDNAVALDALQPAQVQGKVILTEIPNIRRAERTRWREMLQAQNNFMSTAERLNPALVVTIDRQNRRGGGRGAGRLRDASALPVTPVEARSRTPSVPVVGLHNAQAARLYDALKPGLNAVKFSMRLAAPVEKPVRLRNVAGLLRGSDPLLRDTYVLVTAHYDHIGMQTGAAAATGGDHIFNGANDDGSGTVSVIELASVLSTLKQRPRRSILFMTYFGEERGGLGSRHYGRNPIFPIDKTVANINLEQVGRTDDKEGARVATANLTGFDYSDVGTIFQTAGEQTGIRVFKHERNSDAYFSRSDNQSLADLGVPAHTLSVAYDFPDYHGLGDHWDKIDYTNLEKIVRMIGTGVLLIANNPEPPKWNESNPKAERYVNAWRERRLPK
ncbi:MAG TPA: M28 family peptidase [Pyrinomonadaceae bacterium]|jgi:hypothetical protein